MPPQIIIVIALAVGLPIAWLVSEFKPRRWPRIALGILSLTMSTFLAIAIGSLSQLNYNSWYGDASATLIETTIAEIEAGRTESLLAALRKLRGEFYPTYQSRAHYDQL